MAHEAPDPSAFDRIFSEEEELRALMLSDIGEPNDGVEPLSIDEEALVEREYPVPGTTSDPDVSTLKGHRRYLIDRYNGKDLGSEGGIGTVVDAYEVTRIHREGLLFGRRTRAAIVAGSLIATVAVNIGNLKSAVGDLGDELARGTYKVEHLFDKGPHTHTEAHTIAGKVTVADRTFAFKSGSHEPDPAEVAEFTNDIAEMVHHGQKVDMRVGGSSSAERSTRDSLTVPNPPNDVLAMDRRAALKTVLKETFAKDGVAVHVSENLAAENNLTTQEASKFDDALAKEHMTFTQALAMFNQDPATLPEGLRTLFAKDIGAMRSATATVVAKGPDQVSIVEVPNPGEIPPVDPERLYDWNLWPLLGATLALTLRFGLHKELRTRERMVRLPERKSDETWVQLRKEAWAQKTEGKPTEIVDFDPDKKAWVFAPEEHRLQHGAWKFSRKVDVLMREERIQGALTHEYTADDGEQKSMHMLFVDHQPNAETLTIMAEELEKMTLMLQGQPPRFEALMVYPQENAGFHGDPKLIGLGVDEQYEAGTLGVAIPTLGLAEVQMKTDPTRQELRNFFGAQWTVNHEILGHHSDVIEGLPLLYPVKGFDNYFTVKYPWEDVAKDSFAEFPGVNEQVVVQKPWWKRAFRKPEIVSREFEVEYGVADKSDNVTSVTERIHESDPSFAAKMAQARSVRLIGRMPTEYAGTNKSELHAETAAQATTGLPIPFSEANLTVNREGALADADLATGYGVDPVLLERYAERVGASIGPDKMLYWPPSANRNSRVRYGAIKDDPVLGAVYRTAKETALPPEHELITILARVTQLDDKRQAA